MIGAPIKAEVYGEYSFLFKNSIARVLTHTYADCFSSSKKELSFLMLETLAMVSDIVKVQTNLINTGTLKALESRKLVTISSVGIVSTTLLGAEICRIFINLCTEFRVKRAETFKQLELIQE
jgi:hypothetical protein